MSIPRVALGVVFARGLGFISAFALNVYVAYRFGSDHSTDLVFSAFFIPQAVAILMGMHLPAVFVSAFTSIQVTRGVAEAWTFAGSSMKVMALVSCAVAAAGAALSPFLAQAAARDFGPEDVRVVTRIMGFAFCLLLFSGMAVALRGFLNANGRFFLPSLESLAVNATGLVVIACTADRWGAFSVVPGLIAGGAVKVILMLPSYFRLRGKGGSPFLHPAVKDLWGQMAPLAIVIMMQAAHGAIVRALAARIDMEGAVSHITYAEKLISVPQDIFGITLGIVLLPALVRNATKGNLAELRRFVDLGLKMTAFLGIPTAVGIVLLAEPIVGLIYRRGRFDALATVETGAVLRMYAITLLFLGNMILVQAFYAMKRPRAILISGIVSVAVNIPLSLALMGSMRQSGLTLAYSIATGASFAVSLGLFVRYAGLLEFRALGASWIRVAVCPAAMGAGVWSLGHLAGLPLIPRVVCGVALYALLGRLLCREEWVQIRRLWRRDYPGVRHAGED